MCKIQQRQVVEQEPLESLNPDPTGFLFTQGLDSSAVVIPDSRSNVVIGLNMAAPKNSGETDTASYVVGSFFFHYKHMWKAGRRLLWLRP